MLVSWIIPLYNCGPWIGRCIDSIVSQGLGEDMYEIVVVDDGSTDHGPEVVAGYGRSNIRLVRQANQGVSAARNHGLRCARGRYVHFVDADDFLAPGVMRHIAAELEREDPEILFFDYLNFDEEGYEFPSEQLQALPGKHLQCQNLYDYVCARGFYSEVTRQLMKRSFLERHGMAFEGLCVGEDLVFAVRLMRHASAKVAFLDFPVYCYYVRPNSTMRSFDDAKVLRVSDDYVWLGAFLRDTLPGLDYPQWIKDCILFKNVQYAFFQRLVNSRLSLAQLRGIYRRAKEVGLYPITRGGGLFDRTLHHLTDKPWLMKLASYPYRFVFYPFLKRGY